MPQQGQTAAARNLFGRYEILEMIGRGGMGVVYRAVDLTLNRMVALKVLRGELYSNSVVVSRFHREAQAIAQLSHPNIVELYSAGSVDRIPYLAMELIEGQPLGKLLKAERRLPWKRALWIAQQVADALACAHERHIIHRDVKPPNILIQNNDHVYVTDFGLAKLLTADTQLTVDGARLGTPQYMSPEQCMKAELTTSSDLYSLGVVLFVMISGRLPYPKRDKVQLIMDIAAGRPARLREHVPDVPEDVERLVAYLLEKRPEDRPPSAMAAREAIARVRFGYSLEVHRSTMSSALAQLQEGGATGTSDSGGEGAAGGNGVAARLRAMAVGAVRRFRALSVPAQGSILLAAVCLLGLGLGGLVAKGVHPNPRILLASPDRGAAGGWQIEPAIAAFSEQGKDAVMCRIHLADFTVASVSWMDEGQSAAVHLEGVEGTAREGQHAVCRLAAPPVQAASLLVPPGLSEAQALAAIPVSPAELPDRAPLRETSALAAPDAAGHTQVWAASVRDKERRIQLTDLAEGVQEPLAKSPDGAWVLCVPKAEDGPTVCFVRLPARIRD